MEEKIRINLSVKTYETLVNDMESFEFKKEDGSLSKNAFFNQLIVNYAQAYSDKQRMLSQNIEKQLADISLPASQKKELALHLVQCFNNTDINQDDRKDVYITFRPTKQSIKTIRYIEDNELTVISRSGYYRNMFESYINLPKDQRERIIFKPIVEDIQKAINQQKRIRLLSKKNHQLKKTGIVVDPYELSQTKEEMYNYLTMQLTEFKDTRSIRLSNIYDIQILPEPINYDENCLALLKKMSKYGPQFKYETNETEEIVVKFSEEGKRMFDKYYVHRPLPVKVEKDTYYFECSKFQLMSYFKRFGKEAIIISPVSYAKEMEKFHYIAKNTYLNSINNKQE